MARTGKKSGAPRSAQEYLADGGKYNVQINSDGSETRMGHYKDAHGFDVEFSLDPTSPEQRIQEKALLANIKLAPVKSLLNVKALKAAMKELYNEPFITAAMLEKLTGEQAKFTGAALMMTGSVAPRNSALEQYLQITGSQRYLSMKDLLPAQSQAAIQNSQQQGPDPFAGERDSSDEEVFGPAAQ